MKKSIIVIALLVSCTKVETPAVMKQAEKSHDNRVDKLVLEVINSNQSICRRSSPYNCIKPINAPDSGVHALELKVNSTESVNIITYDKEGRPVDLNPDYAIEIKATRSPARIDATVVKQTNAASRK